MKKRAVTVSELNRYVSRLLDEDFMLRDLWIEGEVSNCKYHHSGHIYFTIKDQAASISAVMFERDAKRLTFKLTEGTKIYAKAKITLYEKTGTYQAYVSLIELQGIGVLYEKFEKLKQQLAQEGLFDEKHKKEIPVFPQKVGVITSITGAAIKDIIQVAKRRNSGIPIYIYPVHVQGEHAQKEIIEAIQKANEDKIVDVLIIGRGGGSIEDLWVFNEEALARAVFASSIPIVSAVGHEIDFTICDFVSDSRAPTPSAAAEIVFPSGEEYTELIKRYQRTLSYMMAQTLNKAQDRLSYLISRPVFKEKGKFVYEKMQLVDMLTSDLTKAYKNQIKAFTNQYLLKLEQLEKLSPIATLKRGYSLVTDENTKIIRSVNNVKENQLVNITVADGSFYAKVVKER